LRVGGGSIGADLGHAAEGFVEFGEGFEGAAGVWSFH